jgi:hypothetical protein
MNNVKLCQPNRWSDLPESLPLPSTNLPKLPVENPSDLTQGSELAGALFLAFYQHFREILRLWLFPMPLQDLQLPNESKSEGFSTGNLGKFVEGKGRDSGPYSFGVICCINLIYIAPVVISSQNRS